MEKSFSKVSITIANSEFYFFCDASATLGEAKEAYFQLGKWLNKIDEMAMKECETKCVKNTETQVNNVDITNAPRC